MVVTSAATGKPFATKYVQQVFGQQRSTLDTAYPGDVIGLVNATALQCWSVIYFILGLAQEEQALPHGSGDLAVGERPSLQRVLPFLAEESFDARFEFGITKLLAR